MSNCAFAGIKTEDALSSEVARSATADPCAFSLTRVFLREEQSLTQIFLSLLPFFLRGDTPSPPSHAKLNPQD